MILYLHDMPVRSEVCDKCILFVIMRGNVFIMSVGVQLL